MARTTQMRLIELLVMKQDIMNVLLFLGKNGDFQFQSELDEHSVPSDENVSNRDSDLFTQLDSVRSYLSLKEFDGDLSKAALPTESDYDDIEKILHNVAELNTRDTEAQDIAKRTTEAYKEALSFANLKASYSELEHLSFLSLKIGKIDPSVLDELKFAVGTRALIIPLGEDKTRILAASSKKGRFALDTELKKFGFVPMEIPKDFKGIPDNIIETLRAQNVECEKTLAEIAKEKKNFAETHEEIIKTHLASLCIASQISDIVCKLESTQLVYRITGWIPLADCEEVTKKLDSITEGRISVREYLPEEVPSIVAGHEKVPVNLKNGKFVGSFKRLIFSYGSPVYGTIDPTPFVAVFFTILFGIMFGDAGQGLVFLLLGFLMAKNIVRVGGWNKFAPIFMAIGVTSMIMGLLTGEFFGTETVLAPFSRFVTGLFGEPRNQILPMMPQSNPESIKRMFMFFLFSIAIGFVINSVGILLNIVNNFMRKRVGHALFGKNGLSGALFFWYIVVMVVRMVLFGHKIQVYDWVIIGITIFCSAFSAPLIRLIEGEKPIFENGFGIAIIEAMVELIEIILSYLSNSISFLRVGAFALAHAVLGFIILKLMTIAGGVGAVLIGIVGNAIVIVLEGMIVAIQVIRLQYYEFFSKFFNETGREFKPFCFEYKKA